MANTTHVSVRLPSNLVAEIDLQAKDESRSRAKVIQLRLRESYGLDDGKGTGSGPGRAAERSGGGASVPVLSKAKGSAKHVHAVQPVRGKLAGRRDGVAGLPQPRSTSLSVGSCPHGNRNEAYCRAKGGGC